ncbi:MAG: hypothetical protein C4338_01055, partial [Rhodanobacteraceae bacterium]
MAAAMTACAAWPLMAFARDTPTSAATVTQADARLAGDPLDVRTRELLADPEFGEVTVYASAVDPARG